MASALAASEIQTVVTSAKQKRKQQCYGVVLFLLSIQAKIKLQGQMRVGPILKVVSIRTPSFDKLSPLSKSKLILFGRFCGSVIWLRETPKGTANILA